MKLIPLAFNTVTDKQRERFWKKVDRKQSDECWFWVGAVKGKGYGTIRINKVQFGSTRVGWLIVHGSDPFPLHVLHRCDNSLCHNPAHWFLGTNDDNIVDRKTKGRGGRKLTASDIQDIRRYLACGCSQQTLANDYGVHQTLISAIKRGIVWNCI